MSLENIFPHTHTRVRKLIFFKVFEMSTRRYSLYAISYDDNTQKKKNYVRSLVKKKRFFRFPLPPLYIIHSEVCVFLLLFLDSKKTKNAHIIHTNNTRYGL